MHETRQIDLLTKHVVASVRTDAGCVREANEDSGLHILPNDPDVRASKGTLTIVADGMGGHASGEVASRMAVELIGEFYYGDAQNAPPDALRGAIERANAEIFRASTSEEQYFGMGTTVIALVVRDDAAFAAHVGDSRLYRLRERQIEMLTIDHSQVMEMVKFGIISMEEARHHDDKNVILRAIGTQPAVEVEVSDMFRIEPNDEFLLCSDGLCDMLEDEEIRQLWTGAGDVHAACEQLIAAAKQRGGHDNITVGIVRVAAQNEMETGGSVRVTREIGIA